MNIIEACKGTEYECIAVKIPSILDYATTLRDRYLSSIRTFGRGDRAKEI